jgi:hypothetical protein
MLCNEKKTPTCCRPGGMMVFPYLAPNSEGRFTNIFFEESRGITIDIIT